MREQVCILASCCLCTVWRNAVLKEWTAKKLAVMQERSVLERSPTTIYVQTKIQTVLEVVDTNQGRQNTSVFLIEREQYLKSIVDNTAVCVNVVVQLAK